jgi:hypothetical protein
MPAYLELYGRFTRVRIASRPRLEEFLRTWRFHHPLEAEQLPHAGRIATVKAVGYYHGGDVLYELAEVPGLWHEQLLESVKIELPADDEVRTSERAKQR